MTTSPLIAPARWDDQAGQIAYDGGNKRLCCSMLAKAASKRAFIFTKKPKSSRNLRYDPLSFAVA
jgi:hypothetical protein